MKNPKILVPIDFSELSEHALKTANVFANQFKGTVTPFHAYIPVTDLDGFYYVGSGITPHEKHGEIENVLRQRLQETAQKHVSSDLLTAPLLDIGNPAKAVTYSARDFDLVIMSTHGRTGFSRFIMGSVAEKVLRMCSTPMVTVTSESETGDLSSILLTTDFSENSLKAFPFAGSIAEVTKGTIDLVHVVSHEQFFDAKAAEQTAKKLENDLSELADIHFRNIRDQVRARIVVTAQTPYAEIEKLAHDNKYHLVVMSSVGRSGLEYLMMGSTTSHVVRTVKNAVFTINPRGISLESARKQHFKDRKM